MIDRTQLTEAPSEYEWALLDQWLKGVATTERSHESLLVRFIIQQHKQMRRLLLDFPTDEMVVEAAKVTENFKEAELVLEAVRQTMIGDNHQG